MFFSTHVLSEDIVSRYVKDNKLYSTRLLTKTNKVSFPGWFLDLKHFVCALNYIPRVHNNLRIKTCTYKNVDYAFDLNLLAEQN